MWRVQQGVWRFWQALKDWQQSWKQVMGFRKDSGLGWALGTFAALSEQVTVGYQQVKQVRIACCCESPAAVTPCCLSHTNQALS